MTQQEQVQDAIRALKESPKFRDFPISDIIDDHGHQYVDLVMEGGGVLGIALAGYTYCLEQVGIRFLGVAGTSAGAINALLIAASDTADQEKSDTVINEIANVSLASFVDGNIFAKIIVRVSQWKVHGFIKFILLALPAIPEVFVLMAKLGLNPGRRFHDWLKHCLSNVQISSLADLEKRLSPPDDIKLRPGRNEEGDGRDVNSGFAVIASDLTTRTKVEFPKMTGLYWEDPKQVNPADFVRASMSVPVFFQPFVVNAIPTGQKSKTNWTKLASYEGEIPENVKIVDGGVLSNFPIYVFHNYRFVPRSPTFGVRLGIERDNPEKIGGIPELVKALFRTTRHILDYDFISQNQEYKKLICEIDTGKHYWLNFNLSDDDKKDLFAKGVLAAANFLREFDWQEYKKLRRRLIQNDN